MVFDGINGKPPHPDVRAAIEASAKLCSGLGHSVEASQWPADNAALMASFIDVWMLQLDRQPVCCEERR